MAIFSPPELDKTHTSGWTQIQGADHRHLLDRVQFDTMEPAKDFKRLNRILYTYGDAAGLDADGLSSKDFLRRLAFASLDRWGLAIEFIIEACCRCAGEGRTELKPSDFGVVFSTRMRTGLGFSPFEVDGYETVFDAERMGSLLHA